MENRQLALLLLSTSAFVIFLIASCLPGWIILNIEINTPNNINTIPKKGNNSTEEVTSKSRVVIQISVWYLRTCLSGNCEIKTWQEAKVIQGMDAVNSIDTVEYKVEGVIIVSFCVGAIAVIFANARIRVLSNSSEATVAVILAITASVEAILVARVSGAYTDTEKDISSSPNISLEYSYCLIIVGISVVLHSVGVFLAGAGACKEKKSPQTFTNIETLSGSESNTEIQLSSSPPGQYHVHNLKGLDSIPEEPTTQFNEADPV